MTEPWFDARSDDVPRDEHGNEANGICMNCGAAMVYDPMHPWCANCDEDDEARNRQEGET